MIVDSGDGDLARCLGPCIVTTTVGWIRGTGAAAAATKFNYHRRLWLLLSASGKPWRAICWLARCPALQQASFCLPPNNSCSPSFVFTRQGSQAVSIRYDFSKPTPPTEDVLALIVWLLVPPPRRCLREPKFPEAHNDIRCILPKFTQRYRKRTKACHTLRRLAPICAP